MFFSKNKNNATTQNDDRIKVDTSTITTMVGADTVITGGLKTKSSVRINGTVIGDVRAEGVVILTKTGRIEGTIEAESIIVAGRIDGNMSIRDKVNVEASGQIYGEIITKSFVIDENSIFQGNCIMNRDGKIIPATVYKNKAALEKERLEEEKLEKEKKEKEDLKDEIKRLKEENEKLKEQAKKAIENKSSKDDTDSSESEDAKEESKEDESVDSTESENNESTEEKESAESDSTSEKDENIDENVSDEKADAEAEDDTLIIADINHVKEAEDIPTSDGASFNKRNKKQKKNYVKKSKSLSVEIENE